MTGKIRTRSVDPSILRVAPVGFDNPPSKDGHARGVRAGTATRRAGGEITLPDRLSRRQERDERALTEKDVLRAVLSFPAVSAALTGEEGNLAALKVEKVANRIKVRVTFAGGASTVLSLAETLCRVRLAEGLPIYAVDPPPVPTVDYNV